MTFSKFPSLRTAFIRLWVKPSEIFLRPYFARVFSARPQGRKTNDLSGSGNQKSV
ncbi:MAG: hypothetical protein ACTSR5_10610 [Promethearchaeota archaeon]